VQINGALCDLKHHVWKGLVAYNIGLGGKIEDDDLSIALAEFLSAPLMRREILVGVGWSVRRIIALWKFRCQGVLSGRTVFGLQ